MDQLTANRYARALFQIASGKNEIDEYFHQLSAIYEAIKRDKDFMQVISHPNIVLDEKIILIEKVFKGKVFDDILGFFYVVLRKNRAGEVLEIFESFINMVSEHKNRAAFTSAVHIKTEFSQDLNKKGEAEIEIDSDLIAGLKFTVDNRTIDARDKYQFANIKNELLQTQLA